MCLAVPLEIVELRAGRKALVRRGEDPRGGERTGGGTGGETSGGAHPAEGGSFEIDVSLLDGPCVGDYVLVHAGYAIGTVDRREAEETLRLLASDGPRADG